MYRPTSRAPGCIEWTWEQSWHLERRILHSDNTSVSRLTTLLRDQKCAKITMLKSPFWQICQLAKSRKAFVPLPANVCSCKGSWSISLRHACSLHTASTDFLTRNLNVALPECCLRSLRTCFLSRWLSAPVGIGRVFQTATTWKHGCSSNNFSSITWQSLAININSHVAPALSSSASNHSCTYSGHTLRGQTQIQEGSREPEKRNQI